MISIIVGHWFKMVGINEYQLLSIGVEIFFFVSGYLYARKKIDQCLDWLIKRWKRLIVPFWIVVALNVIIQNGLNVWTSNQFLSLFFNLLNIQGLNRFFLFINTGSISGMGQTWFLTILMLSYFFMLLVKRNPVIEEWIDENIFLVSFLSIVSQILLSFVGVQIIYQICFFIGYFLSRKKWLVRKNYLIVTMLTMLLCVGRLILKRYIDGSILYDQVISRWSFVFLALFIIMILIWMCDKYGSFTEKIVSSKIWMTLDLMSYPLFLTHYMFLSGNLAVNKFILDDVIMQTILFLIMMFFIACIVVAFTNWRGIKAVWKIE